MPTVDGGRRSVCPRTAPAEAEGLAQRKRVPRASASWVDSGGFAGFAHVRMSRLRLQLLLAELQNQTALAEMAWRTVCEGMAARELAADWTDRVWGGLQAFATCQANISKLFFGVGKKPRQQFIDLFAAVDLSPIKSREMRDSFDHFDERLDQWVRERGVGFNVQDRALGANIGAVPPPDQLRRFDPIGHVLTIWSRGGNEERYDVKALLVCIRAIAAEAARIRGPGIASLPDDPDQF